jgi:SAM-dependent methyltransferase
MTDHRILGPVARYYGQRVTAFGATARGADWNSEASQALRFDQLLARLPVAAGDTVNDYGCGYGALALHLAARGLHVARYTGFDVAPQMLTAAGEALDVPFAVELVSDPAALAPADITVASGIFNVRLTTPEGEWKAYVLDTLAHIASVSVRGCACNFLTSYSDADRMRPDLYYADPSLIFDHCKHHFGREVALLHDYGLFEFTIAVRK